MKVTSKITAVIMALILLCTTVMPVFAATDSEPQTRAEYTIEMPDMEMVRAFAEAIENEEHHDTEYSINGTTITVRW